MEFFSLTFSRDALTVVRISKAISTNFFQAWILSSEGVLFFLGESEKGQAYLNGTWRINSDWVTVKVEAAADGAERMADWGRIRPINHWDWWFGSWFIDMYVLRESAFRWGDVVQRQIEVWEGKGGQESECAFTGEGKRQAMRVKWKSITTVESGAKSTLL